MFVVSTSIVSSVSLYLSLLLIQILKLYAWESPFATQAEEYRDGEVKHLKLSNVMIALCAVNLFLLPYLVSHVLYVYI